MTDSTDTLVTMAPAAADGTFTLHVPATAVPPLVASATTDDVVLFSPLAAGGTQRANITPLTHVAAAQLSPTGDPWALARQLKSGSASFDAGKMRQVVAALVEALQPLLANAGAAGVDPITGSFAADGTGHDRMLASLSIAVSPGSAAPGSITISVRGAAAGSDEAPSITFTAGAAPPKLPQAAASVALPPVDGDALVAAWLARAQACFELPRTTGRMRRLPRCPRSAAGRPNSSSPTTASFARIGVIACSRQMAADFHCSPGGGYSPFARLDAFQVTTLDTREREYLAYFSLAPVTAPPAK